MSKHKELSIKERVKRLDDLIVYTEENDFDKDLIAGYKLQRAVLNEEIDKDTAKRKAKRLLLKSR